MARGLQVPLFVVNLNFFTVTALWAVQEFLEAKNSGSETDRFFSTLHQDMALSSSTSLLLLDLVWPWSAPAWSHSTQRKVTYYFGLVIKPTSKAIIYSDNYRETFSNIQLSFMWSRWPILGTVLYFKSFFKLHNHVQCGAHTMRSKLREEHFTSQINLNLGCKWNGGKDAHIICDIYYNSLSW